MWLTLSELDTDTDYMPGVRLRSEVEREIAHENRALGHDGEYSHGTVAGAKRHYRAGEPCCIACLEAARENKAMHARMRAGR